jgi:hypothetical protein
MPFSIVALASGLTRIALEGALDVFSIDGLLPELLIVVRQRPTVVELDLSRLRSLSKRTMQILLAFLADLAEIDCRIVVTEAHGQAVNCHNWAFLDAIRDASGLVK